MRIAILILLHEYKEQQRRLILDLSKDFSVFVHIDKKSNIDVKDLQLSNVYAFKKFKVYWGSYNQIRATLFLFQQANKQHFERYIFISGSDVPLKSNKEIIEFFLQNNNEYLEFQQLPSPWWNGNGGFDRIDYFYTNNISRCKINMFKKLYIKIINKIITPFMKRHKLSRRIKNIKYFGGTNWMDLTDNCVSQIIHFIENNKWFLKKFRYTHCADEIFFQTIICNFINHISLENTLLRYIDWESGPEYPKILRTEDLKNILESNCLFARKFNSQIDNNIIDILYNKLEQNNLNN